MSIFINNLSSYFFVLNMRVHRPFRRHRAKMVERRKMMKRGKKNCQNAINKTPHLSRREQQQTKLKQPYKITFPLESLEDTAMKNVLYSGFLILVIASYLTPCLPHEAVLPRSIMALCRAIRTNVRAAAKTIYVCRHPIQDHRFVSSTELSRENYSLKTFFRQFKVYYDHVGNYLRINGMEVKKYLYDYLSTNYRRYGWLFTGIYFHVESVNFVAELTVTLDQGEPFRIYLEFEYLSRAGRYDTMLAEYGRFDGLGCCRTRIERPLRGEVIFGNEE